LFRGIEREHQLDEEDLVFGGVVKIVGLVVQFELGFVDSELSRVWVTVLASSPV
jgi:hypothetical protein